LGAGKTNAVLQTKMDTGAVTDLRYINDAITTARMVMTYSHHSSLGGLQATTFAVGMGARLSNLSTKASSDMYYAWWVLQQRP
jgi:isoaspartyl peptidase/L-asparaginase-like protein (Ntn-hydrolase superfamily)